MCACEWVKYCKVLWAVSRLEKHYKNARPCKTVYCFLLTKKRISGFRDQILTQRLRISLNCGSHWESHYNIATFCWETLAAGVHVETTWHTASRCFHLVSLCVCVCVCVCVLINGGRHFFCNTVVKMSICLLASLKVQVVAIVKVKAEFWRWCTLVLTRGTK